MGTTRPAIQRAVTVFCRPSSVVAAAIPPHLTPMRILLASLVLLAGTGAAAAQPCVSRPDSAATNYTANQSALALCRLDAIADATRQRQDQLLLEQQQRLRLNQLELTQRLDALRPDLPVLP